MTKRWFGPSRGVGLASMIAAAALLGTVVMAQQNQAPAGRQGGAGAAAGQGRQGGAPAPAAPAAGRQGGAPNFDTIEVKVLPVQGNVYLANGGFVNAAFSVGDDGVVV